MKKAILSFLFIFSTVLLVNNSFAQHQLVKLWQTDSVFKVPESVLFDASANILYVSNIDGAPDAKDGKGSVGKLGTDGKVIAVDWVKGLDAPKGLGIFRNRLYAADVDKVVVIDIIKGAIIKKIPVEGAQFLNDITVNDKGVVFVSDTKTGKVHSIENDKVSLYAEGYNNPNGLLAVGNDLYVLASGTMYKNGHDVKTKVAGGMENATDGLEKVKDNEYLVSVWNGIIYYVSADGSVQQMLDTRGDKINSADIGYDAKNRIVFVPTFFKNSVVAYQLK
jgi:hypothetical protein